MYRWVFFVTRTLNRMPVAYKKASTALRRFAEKNRLQNDFKMFFKSLKICQAHWQMPENHSSSILRVLRAQKCCSK